MNYQIIKNHKYVIVHNINKKSVQLYVFNTIVKDNRTVN